MGKGGHAAPPQALNFAEKRGRQSTDEIPFSIGTLRRAIPPHCFERSVLKASAYLAVDLAFVALLYWGSTFIDSFPVAVRCLLWPTYWFCQGAVCTGVWVIAHECGHQSFSKWQNVNDAVGLLLHTALLVPYYSWKHSHRRHHSNTGSAEKDEVFVPTVKAQADDGDFWRSVAPYRALELTITLTLGWPLYLITNMSGREYPRWANHFDPYSPIYSRRERSEILISDCALGLAFSGLYTLAKTFGWLWLAKVYTVPYLIAYMWLIMITLLEHTRPSMLHLKELVYVVPYLIVNMWLVMITLLQHTHPSLPHYNDKEWEWLRGALSTVDRSYGLLDIVFHHIADTHVCHHLFSAMPHYHAQEATEAIKPILGKYYAKDTRNVWRALWQDWDACHYAAPETPGSGIFWFHR